MYTITIIVTPNKEAKNMSDISLNIDSKESVTYQQIISALMAVTENLIKDNKIKTDEKTNIQLEQSQATTT